MLYSQQEAWSSVISRGIRLLKLRPNNQRMRYLVGQAYANRKSLSDAMLQFREITLADPSFEIARIDLGYMYIFSQSLSEALRQFSEIQNESPLAVEALIGSALAHQLEREYSLSIQDLQTALEREPNNTRLRLLLGNTYVAQKRFSEAAEQFRQIEDPSVLESRIGERELRVYYGEQAEIAATQYNLGILARYRRWFSLAGEAFGTAEWRTPDNPLLHYAIGTLHFQAKRLDQAQESFKKVLELDAKHHYIQKALGDIYYQQDDFDKAIQAYQSYMEEESDDGQLCLLIGVIYEERNQTEQALSTYLNCLESAPDQTFILNQLAWFYAEQGQELDTALRFGQQAAEQQPSAGIIDTLGWVHYQRGEYAEAQAQFQTALEQAPFHPTIRYHLGLAYYAQQQYDMARETFDEVLELDQDFEYADEIQRLLEQIP
jgi:tetratricopeptide (TPR) repeat protein